LLLGEWGGMTEGDHPLLDLNLKYLRCMRDFILENKYKLHHTFWCINIDSADTGGLFTRDEGTPFPGEEILSGMTTSTTITCILFFGKPRTESYRS